MTVKRALEILTDASARFANVSRHDVPIHEWHDKYLDPLEESLLETDPFSPLKFGWMCGPEGSGRAMPGLLAVWVIEMLKDGLGPQEIIDRIADEIAENVSRTIEVTAIFGADVDRVVQLSEQVSIIPARQVPAKWRRLNVQKSLHQSEFEFPNCCVLTQLVTVTPGMVFRQSLDEEFDADVGTTYPALEERARVRQLVRLAFLLSGSRPIEIPAQTLVADGDRFLALRGVRYGTVAHGRLPHATQFKALEVEATFTALSQFKLAEQESLFRAIDRLGRARSEVMAADQALDLGIAAEILLTHGADSKNTEVTNKLAIRAAWFLGKDGEQRLEIFRRAKDLYRARSQAAHSGKLPKRHAFNHAAADQLVASLARALTERGRFPEWDVLCLAG